MLDKPFYRDLFFWNGMAMGLLVNACQNWTAQTRLFASIHRGLGSGFLMGMAAHIALRELIRRRVANVEKQHFDYEVSYLHSLGRQKGKFLENNEAEIKEAFKTIVF